MIDLASLRNAADAVVQEVLARLSGAIPVARKPAAWPVGGQKQILLPINAAGSWTNLLQWQSGDGSSRKGLLTLIHDTPVQATPEPGRPAWLARVTMGAQRGAIKRYVGMPCEVPVSGASITVDVLPVFTPIVFNTQNGDQQTPFKSTLNTYRSTLSAVLADDFADTTPPIILVPNSPLGALGVGVQGPIFVQSIVLTNESTSAVQVVINDTYAAELATPELTTSIVVPALSSIGIGADVLGPFAGGLAMGAVLDISAGPPNFGGNDPNGAKVFATVTGVPLIIGA